MILDYKFNEEAYLYKTFVNFLLKNKNFFEKLESMIQLSQFQLVIKD